MTSESTHGASVADGDDRASFEAEKADWATTMAADRSLAAKALDVLVAADEHNYSYQWSWLGLPIIQLPQDAFAIQELIWRTRPELIVETGVARGGSVLFYASILELMGEGEVVGIDIDIRPHNREAIESHRLSKRIVLVQGSSVDELVVQRVHELARGLDRVMVILDSNHTHDHVLAELRAYAPLVSEGQMLVVADTGVEYVPEPPNRPREWGKGDNPATALAEYLLEDARFEVDGIADKLLFTSSPGGYLRCTASPSAARKSFQ